MRWTWMAGLVAGACLLTPIPAAGAQEAPEQIIVVTSDTWHSQKAMLRRYAHTGDRWHQVGRSVPAWVGINGFAPAKKRQQNSGQTPAGTFTLPLAFGRFAQPSAQLPYLRYTNSTYWPYDPRDPRTYNVLQPRRGDRARWRADGEWSERLADYGRQYHFGVVIGFNLPRGTRFVPKHGEWRARQPARINRGGGIFLHADRDRPTAGCVAIDYARMRRVLLWLDAAKHPRIVMGPRDYTEKWRQRVR